MKYVYVPNDGPPEPEDYESEWEFKAACKAYWASHRDDVDEYDLELAHGYAD